MYYVVYWRFMAGTFDMRTFEDMDELMGWMKKEQKIDTIAIIGIYDRDTTVGETEEAIKQFRKFIQEE